MPRRSRGSAFDRWATCCTFFPRRYEDYSQLKPIKSLWYGEQVTVIGTVQSVHTRPIRGGASTIVEVVIGDGTGSLRLSWFNQPWLANRLKEGQQLSVSGTVEQYLGRLVMNQPDWEALDIEHLHTNRIVPIYPLTARIAQKWLRGSDEPGRDLVGAGGRGFAARRGPQLRRADAIG